MKTNNRRIFLVGFMTSGKSTLGKILANVLGWDFADLDQIIEKHEKKKVSEIFEQSGEKYFRNLEKEIFLELCNKEFIVISLGGGTVENKGIMEQINEKGYSIYLKVDPENLYERLKKKTDRPLFREMVLSEKTRKEDFIEKINSIFEKRRPLYEKADFSISSDSQRIGKTVDLIAKKIFRFIDEKN